MMKRVAVASLCGLFLASAAFAEAPASLMKGNWSLHFTPSGGNEILAGYQIVDMLKLGVNFGLSNIDTGDESNTSFNVGGAVHYYLAGFSNHYLSPFIGASLGYADSGIEGQDGDLEVTARLGIETFPIEPLAVGGYIGVGYTQDNDYSGDTDRTNLGTLRSALFVAFYW